MKRLLAGCALALGLLGAGGTALADQVYHTQQIALAPVGGAPLRTGFVVNVHADGPRVFALERYALNGTPTPPARPRWSPCRPPRSRPTPRATGWPRR